ncbi:MAG: uncharacterized protein QOH23_298 [Gaiellaceae bacterium]|nr:uncharacterized protein [Gaiellaceae bacterium]
MAEIALRREDGNPVCERCVLADTALARMKGLLGKRELPSGEGILLKPASAVHMAFMRFAIDAVFLDRELQIVKIAADLRPWRMAASRGAKAVLEIPAGEAKRRGLGVGDRLVTA